MDKCDLKYGDNVVWHAIWFWILKWHVAKYGDPYSEFVLYTQ